MSFNSVFHISCRFRAPASRLKEISRFPTNQKELGSSPDRLICHANNKVSSRASNLLDTLCTQLETFMKYDEGERGLVTQVCRGVAGWRGG